MKDSDRTRRALRWVGRLLLLVCIAPGTLMLLVLALFGVGLELMAESGHYETTGAEKFGGGLLLLGLVALWIAVITGAGARFPRPMRFTLALLLIAGVAGGVIIGRTPDAPGVDFLIFFGTLPLVVAVLECVWLLRREPAVRS